MLKNKVKKGVLFLVVSATLSGCSGTYKKINVESKENLNDISHQFKKLTSKHDSRYFTVHKKGVWTGDQMIKVQKSKVTLPSEFNQQITFYDVNPSDIKGIANNIMRITKIPVRVTNNVIQFELKNKKSQTQGQSGSDINLNISDLKYQGKLSGLLDIVSARSGNSWRYDQDLQSIVFYRFETKTFHLASLPGSAEYETTMSTNSTTGKKSKKGGVANKGGQSTTMKSSLTVWEAVDKAISSILSKDGTYSISESTGSIVVTDTPEVLSKIEAYIDNENKIISRQVVLDVRVLSVDMSNGEKSNIDWKLILKKASQYGINAVSPGNAIANASGMLTQVYKGDFAGSKILAELLQQENNVSLLTSAAITTLNNQPAPVQVGSQITYLASVTTSLVSNAGTSTSLKPSVLVTGFNMSVLPHIMKDNKIMLQYSIDISSLLSMKTITSGTSSIQAPEILSRNFMQRVILKTGETLALAGFEIDNNISSYSGIAAKYKWLGGASNAKIQKRKLIILITPMISK